MGKSDEVGGAIPGRDAVGCAKGGENVFTEVGVEAETEGTRDEKVRIKPAWARSRSVGPARVKDAKSDAASLLAYLPLDGANACEDTCGLRLARM